MRVMWGVRVIWEVRSEGDVGGERSEGEVMSW